MSIQNDHNTMTNEQLAEACKDYGNVEAWIEFRTRFDALFQGRIAKKVHRYGPGVVEDLVSEALFKTIRGLSHFKSDGKLIPWLTTIIDNVVNDYLRAMQRRASGGGEVTYFGSANELASELAAVGLDGRAALQTIESVLHEIGPSRRAWAVEILAGRSVLSIVKQFGAPRDQVYALRDELEARLTDALRRQGANLNDAQTDT
jgi:DNA-directed RNA polymerase specialized sigma24 family protein